MNLTINGETRILAPAETLSALVEQLGMKSDRVAIELNRAIVPREQWAQTPLKDGDRLEIVHFVGGGSGPQSSGLKAQGQEARAYAASPRRWRPRPELNRNCRFRKPVHYPFVLRGRATTNPILSRQFSSVRPLHESWYGAEQ